MKRSVHRATQLAKLLRKRGVVSIARGMWRVYQREKFKGILARLRPNPFEVAGFDENYDQWVEQYDSPSPERREKLTAAIPDMQQHPVISVLMPTYNPPLNFLDEAIQSVRDQIYPHWELCIADDKSTDPEVHKLLEKHAREDDRIKLVFREVNGHICAASNSALELATGQYVALLDNDDILPDHALYCVAETINRNGDAKLIYSDEDKIDEEGQREQPYFKSDWNHDLFLSHNMISHLGVYEIELMREIGGFRKGMHGSQDWDLALRFIEKIEKRQIVHIPKVLYHWRIHEQSTSMAGKNAKPYAYVAGEKALNDHLERKHINGWAEFLPLLGSFRIRYELPEELPLVSLIVPTRNGIKHLSKCVESVLTLTDYANYEIQIIDNGSDDEETLGYLAEVISDARVSVIRDDGPFNYSAINNRAINAARGSFICLLNDDIEVISPNWLSEMVSLAAQPDVAAVGAKLYYPNETLQHGGIVVGVNGVADHAHHGIPRHFPGYFSRAMLLQSCSAVTGACLVIRKSIYEELGGLDEENLKVAYNDVDFCLRAIKAGYRNIWTPYAELFHHESLTRGYEDTPEKTARFEAEIDYMKAHWGEALNNDFAYNPNLDGKRANFRLAWPPRG